MPGRRVSERCSRECQALGNGVKTLSGGGRRRRIVLWTSSRRWKVLNRFSKVAQHPVFLDHSHCLLAKECASGGGVHARWRRGAGGEGPGSRNKQRGSGSADAGGQGSEVQGPQATEASPRMVARRSESLWCQKPLAGDTDNRALPLRESQAVTWTLR